MSRCFLCRHKNSDLSKKSNKSVNDDFFNLDTILVPSSKKDIKSILLHVAERSKIELHIPSGELICNLCYLQVAEYDTFLVKTFKKMGDLTRLLERALTHAFIDSDFEDEIETEIATFDSELNGMTFLQDLDVSDSEINEALRDAAASKKFRNITKMPEEDKDLIQYECDSCSQVFKSKNLFQKHMTQSHKKFSCDICDYSHRNEDYVLLHKNLHEGRSENQCKFCDKEFTTKISTIRHMEAHLNTKKYQCDKCGLCFSQTTVLYNHKLQHEAEEKPLRCEVCNQLFKTKRTYRHHLITHQPDRPRFPCHICNRTFTEKYTLKVHKRTHHEDESPVKKQRTTSLQKSNDVEIITDEAIVLNEPGGNSMDSTMNTDSKMSCIICDQQFLNREKLDKHMASEHDVILRSITSFNNYNTELEISSNESKKTCHICGEVFDNLDYHLESVHGLTFK